MTDKVERVTFNGTKVLAGWPEHLEVSQAITVFHINGKEYPRVPYGNETGYKQESTLSCRDCAAVKGQFHAFGCDMERCPLCDEQALFCGCKYENADSFPQFDKDCTK